VIVKRAGEEVSTIDLFAGTWVLCGGPAGRLWPQFLRNSPSATALRVAYHGIEPAGNLRDVNGRWSAASGVDADGAVLIRPDGFVAWRRRDAGGNAQKALDGAFDHALRRHDEAQSHVKAHAMARK
jgi:hypothetical protein